MKYLSIIFLLFSGLVLTAQTEPQTANANVYNIGFSSLVRNYYEEGLQLNPLNATMQGDARYNDTLPNYLSDDYVKKLKDFYQSYLEKAKKFDTSKLSESEQMSKDILKWECEVSLEGLEFENFTPIDQMWTMNLIIGQLASGASAQPFKTVEDYRNWLARLDDYVIWLKSAQIKMEKGIKKKKVLPKSLIKKVLPQLASVVDPDLDVNLFYTPVKNFPESFSADERAALTKEYEFIIKNSIIPAYQNLYNFMSSDYLDAGRETSGIQGIPNGDDYYKHQIKLYTTTNMTAAEIHEIGLAEVARIRSEMEKVKKEVGFDGDLKSFFDFVRNKKELMPYTDPQQVIDHFNDIYKKMKPQVDR
ncbi:MAG: DUF885 domain-containing protein, partial [Maribacter sp.]